MNGLGHPRCAVPGCTLEACGWISAGDGLGLGADGDGRVWLCPGDWQRIVDGDDQAGVQLELGDAA